MEVDPGPAALRPGGAEEEPAGETSMPGTPGVAGGACNPGGAWAGQVGQESALAWGLCAFSTPALSDSYLYRQTNKQTDRQTDRQKPSNNRIRAHKYSAQIHRHKDTQAHGYAQVAGACAEMLLCAVWAVEHRPRPAKRGRCLYVRTLRVRSVREQPAGAGETGVMHPMQGRDCCVCASACERESERKGERERVCAYACARVSVITYTHTRA
jgi:hypothetical protein